MAGANLTRSRVTSPPAVLGAHARQEVLSQVPRWDLESERASATQSRCARVAPRTTNSPPPCTAQPRCWAGKEGYMWIRILPGSPCCISGPLGWRRVDFSRSCRSSTPRTFSCCAETTSARPSTGSMGSTTNVNAGTTSGSGRPSRTVSTACQSQRLSTRRYAHRPRHRAGTREVPFICTVAAASGGTRRPAVHAPSCGVTCAAHSPSCQAAELTPRL